MASASSSRHHHQRHHDTSGGPEAVPENTVRYWLYPTVVKSRRGSKESPQPAASSLGSTGSPTSPVSSLSPTMSPTRSSPSPPPPTKEDLSLYIMESLAKLNIYLSNYIWQSEPFNLKVVTTRQSTPKHSSDSVLESWIEGSTHYGDNIEDEWFIIFLLKQLTKIDPNLVVRVQDDDGDFLLIEAADHLPRWLSQYPDAGRNRVFLYNGKVS